MTATQPMSVGVRNLIVPIVIALLLPLGFSCSSWSASPPIADTTFSSILVELHLLSARGRQKSPVPVQLRDSILSKYGADSTEFEKTLHYYRRRPEDFERLYRTVVDTLKSIQSQVRSYSPSGTQADSIRQSIPSLRR